MLGRSLARLGLGGERVEEIARDVRGPRGALAEEPLELAQEILHLPGSDVEAAAAEDDEDGLAGVITGAVARRERGSRRDLARRSGGLTELESKAKSPRARHRVADLDAGEIESANRGELAFERDLHRLGFARRRFERHGDRRERFEAIVVEDHHLAGLVVGLVGGEEIEADLCSKHEREGPARGDLRDTFLRAARDDAHRGARAAVLRSVEADVVAARRAALDAHADPRQRERIGHGAAGDGEIGIGERERLDRGATPGLDRRGEALGDARRAEDAAVEQQRARALALGRVAREEMRDMARDGDVALVREPRRDEAAAGPVRLRVARRRGEEAVEHQALRLVAGEPRGEGSAEQARALREHGDGDVVGRVVAEERLLRGPAGEHELAEARRVQFGLSCNHSRLDGVRQREVHVVAAEQQVVADGDAGHLEGRRAGAARAARDADEREIGGAAADVADEHQGVAVGAREEGLDPLGSSAIHVVVERGLGLLEQAHREAGARGGREGQLAGDLIERGRHGEHDLLLGERMTRKRLIPRANDVREQSLRSVDRRDAREIGLFFGRAPGEDRRGGIDPAMAEPALRRRDEATRHLAAALARQLADDPRRIAPRIRGDFALNRRVEERGEERPRGGLGRRDELGNGKDRGLAGAIEGGPRDDGVRGAEIDPDSAARALGGGRHGPRGYQRSPGTGERAASGVRSGGPGVLGSGRAISRSRSGRRALRESRRRSCRRSPRREMRRSSPSNRGSRRCSCWRGRAPDAPGSGSVGR